MKRFGIYATIVATVAVIAACGVNDKQAQPVFQNAEICP